MAPTTLDWPREGHLGFASDQPWTSAVRNYCTAKLANQLMAEGIAVSAVHLGMVNTEIVPSMFRLFRGIFIQAPECAAAEVREQSTRGVAGKGDVCQLSSGH